MNNKMSCCVCGERENLDKGIEITIQDWDGKIKHKNYCNNDYCREQGRKESRKLTREAYGLKPEDDGVFAIGDKQ